MEPGWAVEAGSRWNPVLQGRAETETRLPRPQPRPQHQARPPRQHSAAAAARLVSHSGQRGLRGRWLPWATRSEALGFQQLQTPKASSPRTRPASARNRSPGRGGGARALSNGPRRWQLRGANLPVLRSSRRLQGRRLCIHGSPRPRLARETLRNGKRVLGGGGVSI